MTAKELGEIVKRRRKSLKMNQAELALVSGTGVRFISDLENGKETCVVGKTLKVMETLGILCFDRGASNPEREDDGGRKNYE